MHLSRLNQHATSNPGPSFLAGRDRLARRMNGSTTENPKRDIPHSSWIERRAKRPPSVSDVDPGDRCPERRRRAALVRPERYRASERQVCRVVGQHRSTQRHPAKVISIEKAKLRHRLWEIASEHIRWGRRMAYRLLRREGWTVNHTRVQRLWHEEGLQRPTPRKRKRARPSDGSVRRHRAEHPHKVRAMDFQFDATADGRRLKFLNVIDEHSRLCLAIRVGRRCKAKDVVAVLQELTSVYPAPAYIRSDNGPEFMAQALRNWCDASDTTTTAYIKPGSPWENGFAESFNGRFRDVFLNTEMFTTAPEAQLLADR